LGAPRLFHAEWSRNLFEEWLAPIFVRAGVAEREVGGLKEWALMGIATLVSAGGIALAWVLYGRGPAPATERLAGALPRLYRVVLNKYYVDEIYDAIIVRPLRRTAFYLWKVADAFVIDGLVKLGAIVVYGVGGLLRYLQNGDV